MDRSLIAFAIKTTGNNCSILIIARFLDHGAGKIGEDQVMQRQDAVPIESAEQTMGYEMGCLYQLLRLYIEFKPGLARNLHLGIEEQPLSWLDIDDFPEIEGIANPEF